MATGDIEVTAGTGTSVASHTITEDAKTKHLPRHVPSDSAGAEIFGSKTDAKSTATDTTSASLIAIEKQISASVQSLESNAVSQVAHDASDAATLPIKTGYKAAAGMSGQTLVSAGDRSNTYGDLGGATYVRPHCGLEDIVDGTASNTDGTSTQVIAAAGAGIKLYLAKASLSNTHASTGVMVALKSATTSRWRVYVPPGGREVNFDPPLPPNAANEAWNFDPDSAVSTIECSMVGFKSKI